MGPHGEGVSMRLLTLPFRYWWATTVIVLVFWWLSCGTAQTTMRGEWRFEERTSPPIKMAIMRMGPMYYYRTLWTGELQVNKYTSDDLDERWERLRY